MGERTRSRIGTCEGVKTVRVYSANPKTADGYNTFIFRRDVARSLNKLAWAPVIDGSRNTIPEGIKIGDESVRYSADEKKRLLDFVERLANAQKGPVENDDFGRFEITKVFATEVQCHAISTRREIEAVSSAAEIARSMVHFVGSPNEELKRKKPNKYFEYGLAKIRLSDGVYLVMGEVGIRVNKRPYYDQRVVAKFKADSEVTSLHGQTQIGESAFERVYDNRFRLILQGVVMYYNTRSSNQTISNQTIKQSPRISFVIPVYKTPEQLLRNCLDSVLRYSQPMELICVLDSPGDPCEQVLDEYAAKEPRMRLLKNDQNRGVSYSRNRGMDAAMGEYLTFVDADDEVVASVYERQCAELLMRGTDAEIMATRRNDEVVEREHWGVPPGDGFVASIMDGDGLGAKLVNVSWFSAYPIIFRRDALVRSGARFIEGKKYGEDYVFVTQFLSSGVKVGYRNVCGYVSVGHPQSTCQVGASAKRCLDTIETAVLTCELATEADIHRDALRIYLTRALRMALCDFDVRRMVVSVEGRNQYGNWLSRFFRVLGRNASTLSWVTSSVLAVISRFPSLIYTPGAPIQNCIRTIGHFGLLVK